MKITIFMRIPFEKRKIKHFQANFTVLVQKRLKTH